MTGIAIEAGTAHPELIPSFNGVRVSHSLVICVVFFLPVFVFLSFCYVPIVLSPNIGLGLG
jgi:hypothetical protein